MVSIKLIATTALLAFITNAAAQRPAPPCGLDNSECPEDMKCVPNSDDCTDLKTCEGTCEYKNTYPDCGGHRINPPSCDDTATCKDDPRWPSGCQMACDLPGICVPNDAPQCGGFAGFECPEGLYCYDNPDDDCDPDNGGSDCIGICL